MSKAATEKPLSHQNFDIDKATPHAACVASKSYQLLRRGPRQLPVLICISFIPFIQQMHTRVHYVLKPVCLNVLRKSLFFSSNLKDYAGDQKK